MDLILDTNIYRNLVRGLNEEQVINMAKTIKQRTNQQAIKILFPINSAMELIAHYNDEHPVEQQECRLALRLLVEISTTMDASSLHVDFIPGLNGILERYIQEDADTHSKLYAAVINVAQMLVGNIQKTNDEIVNKDIKTIKEQIEFEKQEIRDNYEGFLRMINDGEADWTYFNTKANKQERDKFFANLRNGKYSFLVAQSIFDRAHNLVQKQIVKDQAYLDRLITFMQEFCPALLMNELLLEQIGHGTEAIKEVADKRWNTIIDISLIFGVLFNTKKIDRRLVTEEKNIHAAFTGCGFEQKIINLTTFRQIFGI